MTVLETREQIVEDLALGGAEIPSFAILGTEAFHRLYRDCSYYNMERKFNSHINIITTHAIICVQPSTQVPADHISVGGRTILDIIAEKILLGEI